MTKKAKKVAAVDGDTLKMVREAAGVSGAALSAKIGRNRSWASSVEAGRYALTEYDAAAVCEALGVSIECFGIKEGAGPSLLKFRPEVMVEAARARGWSIRHLAQLIGVNPVNVYKWQHKGAQPERRNVEVLAETLEMSIDDFYVKEEAKPTAPSKPISNPQEASTATQLDADYVLVRVPKEAWARIGPAMSLAAGCPINPIASDELAAALRALLTLLH